MGGARERDLGWLPTSELLLGGTVLLRWGGGRQTGWEEYLLPILKSWTRERARRDSRGYLQPPPIPHPVLYKWGN